MLRAVALPIPQWVVGGWNVLEPDSNQPLAGNYRLRYGVLGLRYTFDKFRKMVYSEIRLDDSLNSDGTRLGNTYIHPGGSLGYSLMRTPYSVDYFVAHPDVCRI